MRFLEAIAIICAEKNGPDEPFITYSRICDLCQNNHEDVRKGKLFFHIDQRLSVVRRFRKDPGIAAKELEKMVEQVNDITDENTYQKLITSVLGVLTGKKQMSPSGNPSPQKAVNPAKITGETSQKKKTTPGVTPNSPAAPRKNNNQSPKKPGASGKPDNMPVTVPKQPKAPKAPKVGVIVQGTQQSQNKQQKPAKRFSQFTTYVYGYSKTSAFREILWWLYYVSVLTASMFGLVQIYRAVATHDLAVWAKVLIGIGVVVGSFLIIVLFSVSECHSFSVLLATSVFLLCAVICRWAFGSETLFLSVCVIGLMLILLAIYSMSKEDFGEFYNWPYDWGDWDEWYYGICAMVFFLALISLGAVLSFPLAMQIIIGIAFVILFPLAVWSVAYDEMVAEYVLPAVATLVSLVLNGILLIVFRERYSVAFGIISVTCLIHSVYQAWHCFDDYESGIGFFAIGDIVVSLAGIVISVYVSKNLFL